MIVLSEINYLAVVLVAAISFGIGAFWYSPLLFGNRWQRLVNLTDEDVKKSAFKAFGGSAFLILIQSLGIEIVINQIGEDSIKMLSGAMIGFLVAILFVGTTLGINYLYQRKSLQLFLIDFGYPLCYLALAGAFLVLL